MPDPDYAYRQRNWQLDFDDGKYIIREVCVKVVAVCDSSAEAVQAVRDWTEERSRQENGAAND